MEIMSMIEHQKLILKNVTDNVELFAKELKKSINWLAADDVEKLYIWVNTNYGESHKEIIRHAFATEAL